MLFDDVEYFSGLDDPSIVGPILRRQLFREEIVIGLADDLAELAPSSAQKRWLPKLNRPSRSLRIML